MDDCLNGPDAPARRLLFLTSTLPRFAGDMQANFVGEQVAAWASARPQDRLTILAPHAPGAAREEQAGPARIVRFRYMVPEGWQQLAYPAILPNIRRNPVLLAQVPLLLLGEYRAASALARAERPDLVYAHWMMPQGLIAWQLKRRLGIPYVLQHHSSDLAAYLKLGAAGRRLAQAVLRGCAHFFCVNSDQLALAASLFDGRERVAFLARATVLPMGIAGLPEPDGPAPQGPAIVSIGRLSAKKGLHYLIDAAEHLAAQGIRPAIALAGDGEDRAALEARVRSADIHFPGFLTGPEKEGFLAEARAFAFPARASGGDVEGLPVALLEALCRGRPVLATRDTNIELLPEWPAIRDAVVFVPDPADLAALADGLKQLAAADPAPARKAAQILGRYRWDRLILEYQAKIAAALGWQEQGERKPCRPSSSH